jgi:outer membrane protein TolC
MSSMFRVPAWCLLLAGCATPVPQVLTPPSCRRHSSGQATSPEQVWPAAGLVAEIRQSGVVRFIAKAQTANRDLAVAAARVMEARAQTTIQRAALFPQLNLQAQGKDRRRVASNRQAP